MYTLSSFTVKQKLFKINFHCQTLQKRQFYKSCTTVELAFYQEGLRVMANYKALTLGNPCNIRYAVDSILLKQQNFKHEIPSTTKTVHAQQFLSHNDL